MKTKIIDRILIIMAYYIFRVVSILFGVSFMVTVGFYVIYDQVPVIISYLFWFFFGAFCFNIIVKKAFSFLDKKHEEKNAYYLEIISKRR